MTSAAVQAQWRPRQHPAAQSQSRQAGPPQPCRSCWRCPQSAAAGGEDRPPAPWPSWAAACPGRPKTGASSAPAPRPRPRSQLPPPRLLPTGKPHGCCRRRRHRRPTPGPPGRRLRRRQPPRCCQSQRGPDPPRWRHTPARPPRWWPLQRSGRQQASSQQPCPPGVGAAAEGHALGRRAASRRLGRERQATRSRRSVGSSKRRSSSSRGSRAAAAAERPH